jgi:hypothetical protein
MASHERKLFRCAIYTRKSSEHGLEQDFNSLDAQRFGYVGPRWWIRPWLWWVRS